MSQHNTVDAISVTQLTNSRGREVTNQFVISLTSGRYFQSYRTIIAYICNMGRLTLDKNYWDYSRTTSTHRNAFTGLTSKETKQGIKDGSIQLANLNGMNHIV